MKTCSLFLIAAQQYGQYFVDPSVSARSYLPSPRSLGDGLITSSPSFPVFQQNPLTQHAQAFPQFSDQMYQNVPGFSHSDPWSSLNMDEADWGIMLPNPGQGLHGMAPNSQQAYMGVPSNASESTDPTDSETSSDSGNEDLQLPPEWNGMSVPEVGRLIFYQHRRFKKAWRRFR